MLAWKEESNGRTALLIEGQRRVGKSTLVEEFARNEYESYFPVDFYSASSATKKLFDNLSDLNYIFLQLQQTYLFLQIYKIEELDFIIEKDGSVMSESCLSVSYNISIEAHKAET